MMTKNQKQQIERLRKDGYTYKAIAEALGLSFDSVKCYCRRSGFTGNGHKKGIDTCDEYGAVLQQLPGKRKKRFCSTKCRMAWWQSTEISLIKNQQPRWCADTAVKHLQPTTVKTVNTAHPSAMGKRGARHGKNSHSN